MNHRRRHTDILPLSSDLRLRILPRRRESTCRQWIACHVPLSVSLAHETPHCYVTDGDSDKLAGSMMSDLGAIINAAFDMLIPSYDNVLNELEVQRRLGTKPNARRLNRMNPNRRTTRR